MILTIPRLIPGKTYSLQIRSKVDGRVSPWSASHVFQAEATGPLPATPQNPTFVVSGDSFYAEWDSVETDIIGNLAVITRYEVEFSSGAQTRHISVAQQTADKIGHILSFEENRALFGTPKATVSMRVRSVNSIGFKSAWTAIIGVTNPPPAAVTGLTVSSLLDSISVKWDASAETDVIEYRVQHAASASGPWSTVYEGSNNAVVHPNVMWNDDSFYRVAAIDKFGSVGSYIESVAIRPQSSFGGDSTPPANATGVTATPGFDAARQVAYIDVSWTESVDNDVSNYLVRYSTNGSSWQYVSVAGDLTGVRLDNLSPGLSYSIGVRAKDFSGNDAAAWANATPYPVTTAADTTAPSQPSAPTASVGVDRIQVTISGTKAAGGAMEADVTHYQVHASTTTAFTPSNTTQLGTIDASPAMVGVFYIPASSASGTTQTWYVRIRAVDRAGNISPVSTQTTAAVNLIQTASIGDAQITNAKISSLEANKITAGTGIINDLTVKAKLTLGDNSSVGTIESYDYQASSGATGFTMSKNGLIIKSGSIDASALNISLGENIIRPEYASFEWSEYANRLSPSGMLASVNSGTAFNGNKFLATVWGAASANPTVYLGSSATDYNQRLVVGQRYIISAYARVTGAVGTQVNLKVKDATGAISTLGSVTPATGSTSWVRFSGVYTATTENILVFFDSPTWTASAGFDIDAIQIERAYGTSTVPSQWRPPSITQIDGGTIRTGVIQSTAEAVDILGNAITGVPAWSINTNGSAQFGNVNVRGRIIMGDSNDPVVDPETGAETTLTGLSAMQSYNYVSGASGWAIKGNGVAEFRQVLANSLHGSALVAESVDAERIRSSAINTRHIQAGAVSADKFAAQLLLSSKIIIGNEYSTSNLDPEGLNPNIFPPISAGSISTLATSDNGTSLNMPSIGAWGQYTTGANTWSATSVVADYNDPVFANSLIADGAPAWTTTMAASGASNLSLRANNPTGLAADVYRISYGLRVTGGSAKIASIYSLNNTIANAYGNARYHLNVSEVDDADGIVWVDVIAQRWELPENTAGWANHILFQVDTATAGATIEIIAPEMRKWDIPSNNVALFIENSSTTPTLESVSTPDYAITKPGLSGLSLPPTASYTFGWTEKDYSPSSKTYDAFSVGAVTPPYNDGNNSYIGQTRGFEQTFQASTQDTGTFALTYRLPLTAVPETGKGWTHWLTFRAEPNANKAYYNSTKVELHWYDADNVTVQSNPNLWSDISGRTKMTAANGGQFLVKIPEPPATATHGVVKFASEFQGNLMPLADVAYAYFGSIRVFSLENINQRFGEISGSRIEQSIDGISLLNAESQPQVRIPVDSSETAFFKGAGEFGSLRVIGGLSLESTGNEIAKDGKLSLSNGITSPVSAVTIEQKYETVQCETNPWWTSEVLNWSNVTSMVWHPVANKFIITALKDGKLYFWKMDTAGKLSHWNAMSGGSAYTQAAVFLQPTAIADDTNGTYYSWIARFDNDLIIRHFPGAGGESGSVYNRVDSGAANGPFFANTTQPAAWWASDNKLVIAQNVSTTKAWIKRYTLSSTNNAFLTSAAVYEVPGGAGGGLAGGYEGSQSFGASRWVLADRVTSNTVKVFDESAKTRVASEEWPVAPGTPVAFCRGPEGFVQVDSNGVMTKYSDWTWNTTTDKIYAGITWYDDDVAGTGTHETDLTKIVSATLKKRIGYINITAPQVPDKNGSDDPSKFRLYLARTTGTLSVPANRTSFWSQYEGGSPGSQTTVTVPADGIQTNTINPPAANNFPGAGPAELHSFASDGDGNKISLKGDGSWRLGGLSNAGSATTTLLNGTNLYSSNAGAVTGWVFNGSGAWRMGGMSGAANGDISFSSTWQNFPFASGFTSFDEGAYKVKYRRVMNMVFLSGLIKPNSGNFTANNVMVGTIPVGFRPPITWNSAVPTSATASGPGRLVVADTGQVNVLGANGLAWIGFYGVYLMD